MISDRALRRLMRSDASVALAGDLVRALLIVGLTGLVGLYYLYHAATARFMSSELHMNDFGKFYYSSTAFLNGADMYGPNPATAIPVGAEIRQFWNMNPPHFHVLILPFALLAPLPALVSWSILNLAALTWALRLIARELAVRWTWHRLVLTLVAVLVCSATGLVVTTGQMTFLLMLPVTLAWIVARHDRWPRAAVYLGVAASVKPFLGVFWIYLLLTKRFRPAAIMMLSAIVCLLGGVVVFGWTAHVAWLHGLSGVDWSWAPMNGSIHGLLSRTLADSPLFAPVLRAPAVIAPAAGVLALVVGVGALAALVRDTSVEATDRVFAGLLLTALLVSPLGWMYYLWLVAGPVVALWMTRRQRPSRARNAAIVVATPGLLFPLYMTTAWRDHPLVSLTLGSAYGWTLLALWAAVMLDWTVRHTTEHGASL